MPLALEDLFLSNYFLDVLQFDFLEIGEFANMHEITIYYSILVTMQKDLFPCT